MAKNSARGRNSKDLEVGDSLVAFINRNVSEYPTEVGSAFFAPVAVREHKDIMLNIARANAEQEYQRIMSLVSVLQDQAEQLRRRLFITDLVHQAHYKFKPVVNSCYWLVDVDGKSILSSLGPDDWSSGCPNNYKYVCQVKFLGDFTWIEIKDNT